MKLNASVCVSITDARPSVFMYAFACLCQSVGHTETQEHTDRQTDGGRQNDSVGEALNAI